MLGIPKSMKKEKNTIDNIPTLEEDINIQYRS